MRKKGTKKEKSFLRQCKFCGEDFACADVKGNKCPDCLSFIHPCACGCGGDVVGVHRRYLAYHAAGDRNNPKVAEGHQKQGTKITGDKNPSHRIDVRKKISKALLGRCVWKENKSTEEIEEIRGRLFGGIMNGADASYPRRLKAADGNLYRSSFEVEVANLLFSFGIDYVYEKPLKLKDSHVVPDFTLLGNDGSTPRCIIEVTGSAYPAWREHLKEKVRRMRRSHPTLPIVVVTYPTSISYLKEIAGIPFVRLYSLGGGFAPDERVLIVESDAFNFDYSHFLPWHKGRCADFHGHSSTVSVAVRGRVDGQGMIIDFSDVKKIVKIVIDSVDHKVFVPDYCVESKTKNRIIIQFASKKREHRLELPVSEVVLLERDSTVENLSALIGSLILDKMPWNVEEVVTRINEGVGKSAVAVASSVSRSEHGIFRIEDRPGDFLRSLTFYQNVEMVNSNE